MAPASVQTGERKPASHGRAGNARVSPLRPGCGRPRSASSVSGACSGVRVALAQRPLASPRSHGPKARAPSHPSGHPRRKRSVQRLLSSATKWQNTFPLGKILDRHKQLLKPGRIFDDLFCLTWCRSQQGSWRRGRDEWRRCRAHARCRGDRPCTPTRRRAAFAGGALAGTGVRLPLETLREQLACRSGPVAVSAGRAVRTVAPVDVPAASLWKDCVSVASCLFSPHSHTDVTSAPKRLMLNST